MRYHLILVLLGEELHERARRRGASRAMAGAIQRDWTEIVRSLGERPCPPPEKIVRRLADLVSLGAALQEDEE